MAGLLAWAADVVGAGGHSNDEDDANAIPLVFTPEQQQYVRELDRKAASLNRSIQDLRLRLPPPDISQRLPHLHAHSLASNADLALQLNAHSSTKEQAQLREVTLQEENAAFEKAIYNCGDKILEKLQEADLLQTKLQELDLTEKNLWAELENSIAALDGSQSGKSDEPSVESKTIVEAQGDTKASESDLLEKLEIKKKDMCSMEEKVQGLEKKWAQVQENALKQPSPAQREKMLDKQLHSLHDQLAAKQAQAEGLVNEIHLKEMELERLNGVWRRLETNTADANTARNRFGRSNSGYIVDPHHRPSYHMGGRTETQQRLMLLRLLVPWINRTKNVQETKYGNTVELHLDQVDKTWSTQIQDFDHVIISSGHWFSRPLMYRVKNEVIGCSMCASENITDLTKFYGYRKAFRAAFRNLLDRENFKGTIILRTITTPHFEAEESQERGNCVRTKPYKKEEMKMDWDVMMFYMIQVEEFLAAKTEGKKRGLDFKLLDITEAMRPRADGHPNHYGQPSEMRFMLYSDCLHWCLPGPIDLWNELLLQILKIKGDGLNWSV